MLGDRIAVVHGGSLLRVDTPAAIVRAPGDPRIAALVAPGRRESAARHLRALRPMTTNVVQALAIAHLA